jgi:hypothetical protein
MPKTTNLNFLIFFVNQMYPPRATAETNLLEVGWPLSTIFFLLILIILKKGTSQQK